MLLSPGTLFAAVRKPLTLLAIAAMAVASSAQTPAQIRPQPPPPAPAAAGQNPAPVADTKSASSAEEKPTEKQSASGKAGNLSPLDPAVAPPKVFARPRIGLALGGGGAVGLSEIGVLQWFEDNHIPVDLIAGTSMGCLVASLYSTGRTPDQLKRVMTDSVFTSVFSLSGSYTARSFRRRQDSRELPNGIAVGLRHGVSLRNAVLVDQGFNAFLDREFLRYDDRTDFNTLPIPLRCLATDLNDARTVTFARGSLPDAVRASASLPGVFPPYAMNGHQYVDGGVLQNLPTETVRDMRADVVLAVSLPLAPPTKGELDSIFGVLGRSFGVAIEAAERDQRKLADVVIMPDISGFGPADYLKAVQLAQRGYEAAEKQRAALLKFAVSDAQWQAYLAHRTSLDRGPAGPVLRVRVTAPDRATTAAVQRLFAPLVNQPVDTAKIEALLDQVRADGGLDADYTVGYETSRQFADQNSGAAPMPSGTVLVAPAPDQPAQPPGAQSPAVSPPGVGSPKVPEPDAKSGATPVQRPGAPVPKPGTTPTSNQPGVPKTEPSQSASTPAPATPPAEEPSDADRPGASGFAATQEATPESLSNIAARPIILVTVTRRKTGPPFLLLGANVETQTSAITRATIEGVILDQDFGGYGSELRSDITLGYLTHLGTEYFRPLNPLASPQHTVFAAPRVNFLREPFPIFSNQIQISDRLFQSIATGGDIGWTNQRTQELRAGYDFAEIHWTTTIGLDGQPDFSGQSQRARIRYNYDTQDRALVPQFGVHLTAEAAYLYAAVGSPNTPQLSGHFSFAHRFSLRKAPPGTPKNSDRGHEVFVLAGEGGTMFDHNVSQPFRYTLGGPLRLSASAIDQYRGTDYFLLEPALMRRIAQLPQPLGQSIYLGIGLEAAQMHAPGVPVINRQDAYFGVVAETPLGVITLAPAIGSNGERKFVFTLGKLF